MIHTKAETVEFDLKEQDLPDISDVLSYWSEKADGAPMPAWRDIRLADLDAKIIPRVCVVDVQENPLDFHYRFWGTTITDMHRLDFTGRSIREVPPLDYSDCLYDQYQRVYERKTPIAYLNRFMNDAGLRMEYAVVRLPLSSDGVTVDKIMSAETYGQDVEALDDLFRRVASAVTRSAC